MLYSWTWSPYKPTELWNSLSLRLIVRKSQRARHVQFFNFPRVDPDLGYWYITEKISTTNRGSIWKTHSEHYTSDVGDFMHSLSSFLTNLVVICTLYFDAMIIGFFWICLVIGQTPGEGALSKVFVDVSRVKWGVTLTWVTKWIALSRSLPWSTGATGKLCMVSVIFMGLWGANRWRVKSDHMEMASHKGGTIS